VYRSAVIYLSHVALCAKSSTVSSDSPRTSQRTRSIVSVISLSADISENRTVTYFVCVCVCVCDFELSIAVKKHILEQHVGHQAVLRNSTTSRSTNAMSVPTGLPPRGPSLPVCFQVVRTEKECYLDSVLLCLATLPPPIAAAPSPHDTCSVGRATRPFQHRLGEVFLGTVGTP
jgi:hypothetical protein